MVSHYFAYGSNMLSRRLQGRIASAVVIGPARLDGYAWQCNKLGQDGTAKANLVRQEGASVHGVLYRIDEDAWPQLDDFEPDYRRASVEVVHDGRLRMADTYISKLLTERPASQSYMQQIISGATEHHLPPDYIQQIKDACER